MRRRAGRGRMGTPGASGNAWGPNLTCGWRSGRLPSALARPSTAATRPEDRTWPPSARNVGSSCWTACAISSAPASPTRSTSSSRRPSGILRWTLARPGAMRAAARGAARPRQGELGADRLAVLQPVQLTPNEGPLHQRWSPRVQQATSERGLVRLWCHAMQHRASGVARRIQTCATIREEAVLLQPVQRTPNEGPLRQRWSHRVQQATSEPALVRLWCHAMQHHGPWPDERRG